MLKWKVWILLMVGINKCNISHNITYITHSCICYTWCILPKMFVKCTNMNVVTLKLYVYSLLIDGRHCYYHIITKKINSKSHAPLFIWLGLLFYPDFEDRIELLSFQRHFI